MLKFNGNFSFLNQFFKSKEMPKSISGLTPELKKFGKEKKYHKDERFFKYRIYKSLEALVLRSLSGESKNSCLYPSVLSMILQIKGRKYTEDFNLSINNAVTKQDYMNVVKQHSEYASVRTMVKNKMLIRINITNVRNDKKINTKFREICDKNVIIFPINMYFIDIDKNFKYSLQTGHAMVLIIDKKLNKGYLIDPTYSMIKNSEDPPDYYETILHKAYYLVKKILKVEYPIELVDMVCPQYKEQRGNCVYWSMFLAICIINEYERYGKKIIDPYKVIGRIMKKYDTEQKLRELMKNFIYLVLERKDELKSKFKETPGPDILMNIIIGK